MWSGDKGSLWLLSIHEDRMWLPQWWIKKNTKQLVTYAKYLTKNGEPQRHSWEHRRRWLLSYKSSERSRHKLHFYYGFVCYWQFAVCCGRLIMREWLAFHFLLWLVIVCQLVGLSVVMADCHSLWLSSIMSSWLSFSIWIKIIKCFEAACVCLCLFVSVSVCVQSTVCMHVCEHTCICVCVWSCKHV